MTVHYARICTCNQRVIFNTLVAILSFPDDTHITEEVFSQINVTAVTTFCHIDLVQVGAHGKSLLIQHHIATIQTLFISLLRVGL